MSTAATARPSIHLHATLTSPIVRSLGILSLLLISALAIFFLISPKASADTLNYPWPTDTEAPCQFGSGGGSSCINPNDSSDKYDWGVYISGVFHPYHNGYEYRNCTDYTQWKESTINVSVPSTWQNGGQWYGNAPTSEQSTTPKAWDAAVVPGNPGHVAFVESVNSDGTITVSEYNHDTQGHGDMRTGVASTMGFTKFIDFGVHPSSGGTTNPNPIHISAIHTGGGAEGKEGSLSAGWWPLSNNGASQVMEDGTLNGLVWNGQLLVNQGHQTNNWIVLDASGSVTQASISDSDGITPIRIGLLRNDGTFWVTEGLSGSSWTLEQGGVVAGYVSGNRIAVLLSDGTFEVKEGGLGAGWVVENGSVSQGIISGGSNGSGLIGVVIGGTLLVKVGGLGAGWVTENGAVASAQLSYRTGQTPDRIAEIDTAGNYWVKEGIGGGWVLEQGGVTNAAISGNLIGVVMSDGTYEVKQGSLGAGWVTEDGLITQNTLWSGN